MQVLTLTVGPQYQTNCYMVYDTQNRAVVIDPGDEADRIISAIHEHDLTVEAVLLTHNHFDHIMAAQDILCETGAALYAFGDDAATLQDPVRVLLHLSGRDTVCPLVADRTLQDGDTVSVGDMTFSVLHTPGHTPGSCCYLVEDAMFSGDTLFCNSIGRMDMAGGSPRAMLRSVQTLSRLTKNYTVYPGHGPATTLETEKINNPYLRKHGK